MFVLVEMVQVCGVMGDAQDWEVASVWGPFAVAAEAQRAGEAHAFLWRDDPDDDSLYRWVVKELY